MVRIHAGEPVVLRRPLSARFLTGEYPSSSHSRPTWPLLATIFPSPLPGFFGTRLPGRQDTDPGGRTSPFRVFDLPVSSRVARRYPPGSHSRPIWPLLAAIVPSPPPPFCVTRPSRPHDYGYPRPHPFRVLDLPVSSRVAMPNSMTHY